MIVFFVGMLGASPQTPPFGGSAPKTPAGGFAPKTPTGGFAPGHPFSPMIRLYEIYNQNIFLKNKIFIVFFSNFAKYVVFLNFYNFFNIIFFFFIFVKNSHQKLNIFEIFYSCHQVKFLRCKCIVS